MKESNEQLTTRASVEHEEELLLAKRGELLLSFVEAAQQKRPSKMARVFQRIRQTNEFLNCLGRIDKAISEKRQSTVRQYTVSSLFLHECFKALTADRDEQFFFLTGTVVGGTHVLDQRLEFKHNKRSIVGVVGNHTDTHRLLIKLEQFGHRLLAHFHSHPGNGLEATHPSGTDTGFQKRLEDAGYPTVAAIFSRDGYVRFFRLDEDLEIEIYGSGVEQHGKNSFRLTAIS
jgi:hypothetical protein